MTCQLQIKVLNTFLCCATLTCLWPRNSSGLPLTELHLQPGPNGGADQAGRFWLWMRYLSLLRSSGGRTHPPSPPQTQQRSFQKQTNKRLTNKQMEPPPQPGPLRLLCWVKLQKTNYLENGKTSKTNFSIFMALALLGLTRLPQESTNGTFLIATCCFSCSMNFL